MKKSLRLRVSVAESCLRGAPLEWDPMVAVKATWPGARWSQPPVPIGAGTLELALPAPPADYDTRLGYVVFNVRTMTARQSLSLTCPLPGLCPHALRARPRP
jgi:hypothetical protein